MTVGYYRGLELIRNALDNHGIEYDMLITEGESNVNRARNGMVATYLRTDFDVLAFIDADIEFHDGEDFVRLLTDVNDVRGAMIGMKTPDHTEALSAWRDGERLSREDFGRETHVPVDFLGSAVLLVDGHVIMDLWDKNPACTVADPVLGDYPALFENVLSEGTYLTEDYGFCLLARQAGYEILADTRVICSHHGPSVWKF